MSKMATLPVFFAVGSDGKKVAIPLFCATTTTIISMSVCECT